LDINDSGNRKLKPVDKAVMKESPDPDDCTVPDQLEIGQLATTSSLDEFVVDDKHTMCAGQQVVCTASADGNRVDFDTVNGEQLVDITGELDDANDK
jgi:hypothetical protein